MKDKDLQIIGKIIKRIESDMTYCDGETSETFYHNPMLQEACVFNLLQIGELANRLTRAFTDSHPAIPWRQIIGLRNRLVHDYDGIRLTVVWETIKNDFPELKSRLESLLTDG